MRWTNNRTPYDDVRRRTRRRKRWRRRPFRKLWDFEIENHKTDKTEYKSAEICCRPIVFYLWHGAWLAGVVPLGRLIGRSAGRQASRMPICLAFVAIRVVCIVFPFDFVFCVQNFRSEAHWPHSQSRWAESQMKIHPNCGFHPETIGTRHVFWKENKLLDGKLNALQVGVGASGWTVVVNPVVYASDRRQCRISSAPAIQQVISVMPALIAHLGILKRTLTDIIDS